MLWTPQKHPAAAAFQTRNLPPQKQRRLLGLPYNSGQKGPVNLRSLHNQASSTESGSVYDPLGNNKGKNRTGLQRGSPAQEPNDGSRRCSLRFCWTPRHAHVYALTRGALWEMTAKPWAWNCADCTTAVKPQRAASPSTPSSSKHLCCLIISTLA